MHLKALARPAASRGPGTLPFATHRLALGMALTLALMGCEEQFVPDPPPADCDCEAASTAADAGADDAGQTDASTGDAGGTPGDVSDNGYPPGPYGTAVDATLANLDFIRHDGEPVSLADVRAETGAKVLLISTSAEWCSACREEQPLLQALYEEYDDAGFRILLTIFEDLNFAPATLEDVAEWRSLYDLTFLTVLDEGQEGQSGTNSFVDYYNTALTPMNMFVDLETMTILSIEEGALDEANARTIIEAITER